MRSDPLLQLRRILPLKERQDACGGDARQLHRRILYSFVERGRIPSRDELARYAVDPGAALDELRSNDMVIFSADGEPVGAYPFTMEAREHRVRVNGHEVHAMCAVDALAISPMFGMPTQISSRCRVTGEPVGIRQSGTTIENAGETGNVHVGIAWAAAATGASCAASLCLEMVFLRDAGTARLWLEVNPDGRQVLTLPEAVELAKRFFVPLVS